jgi:hypothetical protein
MLTRVLNQILVTVRTARLRGDVELAVTRHEVPDLLGPEQSRVEPAGNRQAIRIRGITYQLRIELIQCGPESREVLVRGLRDDVNVLAATAPAEGLGGGRADYDVSHVVSLERVDNRLAVGIR